MKLLSDKTIQAIWLTGFIWFLIFIVVELMRPGLIATRFVLFIGWLALVISLPVLPVRESHSFWLSVLVAILAGVILLLTTPNWPVAIFASAATFILLLIIRKHD